MSKPPTSNPLLRMSFPQASLRGIQEDPNMILKIGTSMYATLRISGSLKAVGDRVMIGLSVDYPRKYNSLRFNCWIGVLSASSDLFCKKELDYTFQMPNECRYQTLATVQGIERYASTAGIITLGIRVRETSLEANLNDQVNKIYEWLEPQYGSADELVRLRDEHQQLLETMQVIERELANETALRQELQRQSITSRGPNKGLGASVLGISTSNLNINSGTTTSGTTSSSSPATPPLRRTISSEPPAKAIEDEVKAAVSTDSLPELLAIQERLTHLMVQVSSAVKEARLCKICMTELANTMLNKCGHHYCFECASAVFAKAAPAKICPNCRAPIESIIKTFG